MGKGFFSEYLTNFLAPTANFSRISEFHHEPNPPEGYATSAKKYWTRGGHTFPSENHDAESPEILTRRADHSRAIHRKSIITPKNFPGPIKNAHADYFFAAAYSAATLSQLTTLQNAAM
jgi:hypothetical protein